jgi:hypothetical protein
LVAGGLSHARGHGLSAQRTEGREPPLGHGGTGQIGSSLEDGNPMDTCRAQTVSRYSFACQMAGSQDENLGKSGGKGLNRLE